MMILLGRPNLVMMLFMMNFLAVAEVIFPVSLVSIHLVKESIATNRNLMPLDDTEKGPRISSPHVANGHDKGIICRT